MEKIRYVSLQQFVFQIFFISRCARCIALSFLCTSFSFEKKLIVTLLYHDYFVHPRRLKKQC